MKFKGFGLVGLMVIAGCTSSSANYPPLLDAFGKVMLSEGMTTVVREDGAHRLKAQSSVFVGDRIKVGADGVVDIELAPGQVLRLWGGADLQVDQVVSNGAAFGSQMTQTSGVVRVSGDGYMPHTIKIVTPLAEVKTYSENFSVAVDVLRANVTVEAQDNIPVSVSNDHGSQVIEGVGLTVSVSKESPPSVPVPSNR